MSTRISYLTAVKCCSQLSTFHCLFKADQFEFIFKSPYSWNIENKRDLMHDINKYLFVISFHGKTFNNRYINVFTKSPESCYTMSTFFQTQYNFSNVFSVLEALQIVFFNTVFDLLSLFWYHSWKHKFLVLTYVLLISRCE